MLLRTVVFTLSSMLFMSFPSLAKLATPDKIIHQVHERGANAIIIELSMERKFDGVIRHISSGDKQWLNVAFELFPNYYSKLSQQILNALSFALIENPIEVLALAKKHRTLSYSDICNIPPTMHTFKQQKSFFDKVMNKMNKIRKGQFEKSRTDIEMCLWEFERKYTVYF
ncbi:hypothetical protein ID854_21125 [Xenorhabdus sp. M]|uniref:Uncharacterized protein n=1 Tax=Xenorhabdus szentirmaii TaxID=290112 RepID=A0AAW3Z109_9GAMM|nr:hypothetical protein [Xenorhabdus sp. M]MBD2802879.1 hypothetical protein [Xenorhabdus sp. M]